jgi:hypothetical protein
MSVSITLFTMSWGNRTFKTFGFTSNNNSRTNWDINNLSRLSVSWNKWTLWWHVSISGTLYTIWGTDARITFWITRLTWNLVWHIIIPTWDITVTNWIFESIGITSDTVIFSTSTFSTLWSTSVTSTS